MDTFNTEVYFNLLYFSRLMFYINSAINPILYNTMSSRFRERFRRVFGCGKKKPLVRRGGARFASATSTSHTESTRSGGPTGKQLLDWRDGQMQNFNSFEKIEVWTLAESKRRFLGKELAMVERRRRRQAVL